MPLILDLHEATPEFFRSRFPGAVNPLTDRILHLAERISIALAEIVLSVNPARHERLLDLGYPPTSCGSSTNGPSLGRFRPEDHPGPALHRRRHPADRLRRGASPRSTSWTSSSGRGRAPVTASGPAVVFDVFGRGDAEPVLGALAAELGSRDRVASTAGPARGVAAKLAAADVGVSPIQRNPFSEISMPTKVLEYAAMGKPVVCADLPGAREHFDPGMLTWYGLGSGSLAAAPAAGRRRGVPRGRGRAAGVRARELSWDPEAPGYVALIDALAGRAGSARAGRDHR